MWIKYLLWKTFWLSNAWKLLHNYKPVTAIFQNIYCVLKLRVNKQQAACRQTPLNRQFSEGYNNNIWRYLWGIVLTKVWSIDCWPTPSNSGLIIYHWSIRPLRDTSQSHCRRGSGLSTSRMHGTEQQAHTTGAEHDEGPQVSSWRIMIQEKQELPLHSHHPNKQYFHTSSGSGILIYGSLLVDRMPGITKAMDLYTWYASLWAIQNDHDNNFPNIKCLYMNICSMKVIHQHQQQGIDRLPFCGYENKTTVMSMQEPPQSIHQCVKYKGRISDTITYIKQESWHAIAIRTQVGKPGICLQHARSQSWVKVVTTSVSVTPTTLPCQSLTSEASAFIISYLNGVTFIFTLQAARCSSFLSRNN